MHVTLILTAPTRRTPSESSGLHFGFVGAHGKRFECSITVSRKLKPKSLVRNGGTNLRKMETDGEVKVKAKYHQHKSQNHQKNVHHFCPHKKQTHRAAHVFDPKKFQDFQVETEVLRRNSTDSTGNSNWEKICLSTSK